RVAIANAEWQSAKLPDTKGGPSMIVREQSRRRVAVRTQIEGLVGIVSHNLRSLRHVPAGRRTTPSPAWVLLTEAVEGELGLAGMPTQTRLVAAARAETAELQRANTAEA